MLSKSLLSEAYFPGILLCEFDSRSAHDIELHRKRAGWTWDFFLEYINLSALYKDDYSEAKLYDFLLLNNSLIQPLKITIS